MAYYVVFQSFRKEYGSGSRTQQASKLVLVAACKVLKYLQANYNGESDLNTEDQMQDCKMNLNSELKICLESVGPMEAFLHAFGHVLPHLFCIVDYLSWAEVKKKHVPQVSLAKASWAAHKNSFGSPYYPLDNALSSENLGRTILSALSLSWLTVVLFIADKFVGVFTLVKVTDHNNGFKITVSQRSARILQDTLAPSPAPIPEVLALQLADRAIVFFTVLILIVALLLSVSLSPARKAYSSDQLWLSVCVLEIPSVIDISCRIYLYRRPPISLFYGSSDLLFGGWLTCSYSCLGSDACENLEPAQSTLSLSCLLS